MGKVLGEMYAAAAEYRFSDFDEIFSDAQDTLSEADRAEALLMRAQIKLMANDCCALADLREVSGIEKSAFPALLSVWEVSSPDRFILFSTKAGKLDELCQHLPETAQLLEKYLGKAAAVVAMQARSEILYHMGRAEEAIAQTEQYAQWTELSSINKLIAGYLLFRAHLSMGNADLPQKYMLDMIRLAKEDVACARAYRVVRRWTNLATGWSGDLPRFTEDQSQPVLDERIVAMNAGIASVQPNEEPFIDYARRHTETVCTIKEYYVDIFRAMYWLGAGDLKQFESFFVPAYEKASAAQLIVPFAEYGAQLIPALTYAQTHNLCTPDWANKVLIHAQAYETGIVSYRS